MKQKKMQRTDNCSNYVNLGSFSAVDVVILCGLMWAFRLQVHLEQIVFFSSVRPQVFRCTWYLVKSSLSAFLLDIKSKHFEMAKNEQVAIEVINRWIYLFCFVSFAFSSIPNGTNFNILGTATVRLLFWLMPCCFEHLFCLWVRQFKCPFSLFQSCSVCFASNDPLKQMTLFFSRLHLNWING